MTLRRLREMVRTGEPFPMLTCYDATTARHLDAAGVRVLLVGDTAAEMILGHDTTLPAPMPFMLEITAAVKRGAPGALVMADMPFGSYHCGEDVAMAHAVAFVKQAGADMVKLEVDAEDAPLVRRLARAGVPVVARLGSRPQCVKAEGGYRRAGRTPAEAAAIVETAQLMLQQGVTALLLEAVPDAVSREIVALAGHGADLVPVIGCGAGPSCHGHVVVLQDLLGLTRWQPPFVTLKSDLATPLRDAAARWAEHVRSGQYLREGGVYEAKP